MASVNNILARDFVTATANLMRLSESERLVVVGVLKELETEITGSVLSNPGITDWKKARYNALLSQTRSTIKTAYTKINNQTQDYLTGVGQVTVAGASRDFKSLGLPLQSVALTQEQYRAIARTSLIEGAPSAAWWSTQSNSLQNAFVREMRMGYAAGETVDQLVQRIRGTATGARNQYIVNGKKKTFVEYSGGIMDTGTRQAEALVRTSTQQIAGDARRELFRKNSDIIKGVTQISTLDMRTTLQCASRDGMGWYLDGTPIPPNKIPYEGGVPLHWNCRSTEVPITKSFEELGAEKGTDSEYIKQIGEGTRASMDGEVPADLTFDTWFQDLPQQDQVAFLGPSRFRMWKDGGLTFADMVNQRGNPLTLGQLAEAYGVKIEESLLSGIPNIPARPQNALVIEQRAQEIVSETAQEMFSDAFSHVSYINCSSIEEAESLINALERNGWDDGWIKGRSLENIVRVNGQRLKDVKAKGNVSKQ